MESTINQQAAGLQVFFNEELGTNIRIKMIGEEPWFMGKDVCIAAGIGKYRDALSCLDSDERMSTNMDTPGGNQQVTAVNESGMYHLVFQSRKPEAKAFRKWVTGVVLPSIRRTGSYSPSSRTVSNCLPIPKYRPFFDNWKDCVEPFLSNSERKLVAQELGVSYNHVRKVYMGASVSERVARALTRVAMTNKQKGVKYERPLPVYEQLSIEWGEGTIAL